MQNSLSLRFVASLQSCRAFGVRWTGSCSFSLWTAPEFEKRGASYSLVQGVHRRTGPGVANALPKQGIVTFKGLGFVGDLANTRMRGLGFSSTVATITSCTYRSELARGGLIRRGIVARGKSCSSLLKSSCAIRIPKEVQDHTALQWLSGQHARRPVFVVACTNAGQELLVTEDVGFKRVVSENDLVTTFYTTDVSSSSEDDPVEDKERTAGKQKKGKGPHAYAEDSDSESDDEEEKGKDHKKVKLGLLEKTDNSNSEIEALAKYDSIAKATGELPGKYEDSDSESDDDESELTKQEKKRAKAELKLKEKRDKDILKSMKEEIKQKKKEQKASKCEDSESDSDDEEERATKEEKKSAKAELKLKEKHAKDILKLMQEEEKKQKKRKAVKEYADALKSDRDEEGKKKIMLKAKSDESDNDTESEEERNSKPKSELKTSEALANDSEDEEADYGVTDIADAPKIGEEFLLMENDETDAIGLENELVDELDGELDEFDEEDDFWDDEEGDVVVGDGGTGGGVVLGGKEWGKKALELAERVVADCGEDLSIFAFKVCSDRVIRVRLDKLSDKYGSPTLTDIESFSRSFSNALEEAGEAGELPKDMDVEVSSPGAERVVKVPEELERFKDLPMYVQYLERDSEEKDGVFELDSLEMEAGLSVWKIANVKFNREVKGPGRPLNSKQKKWRASVPFGSLKQVRLFLDV